MIDLNSIDRKLKAGNVKAEPGPKKTAGRIKIRSAEKEDNDYAWLYLAG